MRPGRGPCSGAAARGPERCVIFGRRGRSLTRGHRGVGMGQGQRKPSPCWGCRGSPRAQCWGPIAQGRMCQKCPYSSSLSLTRFCSVLHSSAWHSMAQCNTAWHGSMWLSTARHGTAQCGVAWLNAAWLGTARSLPGMPLVHQDTHHIRATLIATHVPPQVQTMGMSSQSKTRQLESATP